jgi:hypothetical protein
MKKGMFLVACFIDFLSQFLLCGMQVPLHEKMVFRVFLHKVFIEKREQYFSFPAMKKEV